MKLTRSNAGVFATMSRFEREIGVHVGLRDTGEHLYLPTKTPTSAPIPLATIIRRNMALHNAAKARTN